MFMGVNNYNHLPTIVIFSNTHHSMMAFSSTIGMVTSKQLIIPCIISVFINLAICNLIGQFSIGMVEVWDKLY